MPQPGKREPAHPLEIRRLLIRPNTHGSMSDRECPNPLKINDNFSILPAENIPPSLARMSLPNKHPLGLSLPTICHNNSESGAVRLGSMPQSRPANAVVFVQVVSLRTIGEELPCGNKTSKLASASREARPRAVVAENVAPEDAGGTPVVTERDEGVCEGNEQFLGWGGQGLGFLGVVVCDEGYGVRRISLHK
jgi:hypothetical protein